MASTSHESDVASPVDPPHVINKRPKDDDSDDPMEPKLQIPTSTFCMDDLSIWDDVLSSSDVEETGLTSTAPTKKKMAFKTKPAKKKLKTVRTTAADSARTVRHTTNSLELVFPLSDNQLRLLTKDPHLRILSDELPSDCSISVDEGLLNLTIPADLPKVQAIHKLEKRLGVLMSLEEIASIRKDIRGDDADADSADSIDVLKLNDRDFFNRMVSTLRNGLPFIKHKKRGEYATRYVLIRTDRLYWKERQQDKHQKKRSFHLTKIVNVLVGKNSKSLRHEQLANIPENCCFTVITKKATLDLSTPTMDPIEVRKFVAYVKGFQRHFLLQMQLASSGQFSKFNFDAKRMMRLQELLKQEQPTAADGEENDDIDDVEGLYAESARLELKETKDVQAQMTENAKQTIVHDDRAQLIEEAKKSKETVMDSDAETMATQAEAVPEESERLLLERQKEQWEAMIEEVKQTKAILMAKEAELQESQMKLLDLREEHMKDAKMLFEDQKKMKRKKDKIKSREKRLNERIADAQLREEECGWSMIAHDDRAHAQMTEEATESKDIIPALSQCANLEVTSLESEMVSRKQIESLLQQCAELCVVGFHIDTEVIRICEAQALLEKYGFDPIQSNGKVGLLIGIKNHDSLERMRRLEASSHLCVPENPLL